MCVNFSELLKFISAVFGWIYGNVRDNLNKPLSCKNNVTELFFGWNVLLIQYQSDGARWGIYVDAGQTEMSVGDKSAKQRPENIQSK